MNEIISFLERILNFLEEFALFGVAVNMLILWLMGENKKNKNKNK